MLGLQIMRLGGSPKILGLLPKGAGMSRADAIRSEMAEIVQEAAEPFLTLGVKAALTNAAKLLGLTPRRAEAYRHGEVRMVPAWEMEELRLRRQQLREQRIARLEHELAVLQALRKEPDEGNRQTVQGFGRLGDGGRSGCREVRSHVLSDCAVG